MLEKKLGIPYFDALQLDITEFHNDDQGRYIIVSKL